MVTHFQYVPIDEQQYPHAKYFWSLEGKASKSAPYTHGIVPKGICELLYIYKGAFRDKVSGQFFQQGDFLIGAQKNVLGEYVLEEDFGVFGTCLQSYTLPVFLSISGDSLMNQNIDTNHFKQLRLLKHQMAATATNIQRMQLMYQVLDDMRMAIAEYDPEFCQLINDISIMAPKELQEVVSSANVSLRQFQRKFKNITGYTPSQFMRIARLQPILDRSDPENLTRLALEFGYYDQAHFINDFKKITNGITPSAYFAGKEALRWKSLGERVAFFQS